MDEIEIEKAKGEDLVIAFNAKFLSECVKAIDDEFINIYFNNTFDVRNFKIKSFINHFV